MRDAEDRIVLVTGATDGIGRLAARGLAAAGATVLVHGRDSARIDETVAALRAVPGAGDVAGYRADFARLAEVRDLAEAVAAAWPRLDVLLNNAGAGAGTPGEPRRESADGHELRFQVNYLAPVLLARLLRPALERGRQARVVNVASIGQSPIDFDDAMLERGYDGWRAYRQSKLALIMASFDLAAELAEDGVTVNALHPGTLLDTKMVRESVGKALGPVEDGAEAELHLALDPALAGVTGRYFDRLSEARAHDQAYDPEARARLRALTDALLGPA